MPITLGPNSGTLLRNLASEAKWVREGDYQLADCYASEIEDTLRFLDGAGQFGRFLPRLTDDLRAFNAALAEVRAARVFDELGFRITNWEPPSPTGNPGDLEVTWPPSTAIFVEVKGPDWQSELSPSELRGERKGRGKWVDLEGRSVSPTDSAFDVIRRNALKKFTGLRPNLVVIVDDLFVSPAQARGVIDEKVVEFFREPDVAVLGGILFITLDYVNGQIRYFVNFYENSQPLPTCQLPAGASAELRSISELQNEYRFGRSFSPLSRFFNRGDGGTDAETKDMYTINAEFQRFRDVNLLI